LTAWGILVLAESIHAQPLSILSTGSGNPLSTVQQELMIPSELRGAWLGFEFGFATDEQPTAGMIPDAATLTLQDLGGAHTAIYFTVDAHGVSWAPSALGAVFVVENAIMRQEIPFPDLSPQLAHQVAYRVSAPLPEDFEGTLVQAYLDLFDNQDLHPSLAWISRIEVIPEPEVWRLGVFGGLLWLGWRATRACWTRPR
jgi:hypothetical protein